jgi:GDPmannose 4,6-dehydratase
VGSASKVAFITGITGQDGTYLAALLLAKGYRVHGLLRSPLGANLSRLRNFLAGVQGGDEIEFHQGDLADPASLHRIMGQVRPHEIYNLAAVSLIPLCADLPAWTADVDALGPQRLLEALRTSGLAQTARFFQPCSSELFGNASESPQRETSAFRPRNGYGTAKLFAYWTVNNYRHQYGMHVTNGILYNHESPLRDELFVTRKITRTAARIRWGLASRLHVGNLDAVRDWGHARDYVFGMWRMLQEPVSDDYVLATGRSSSVRDFVRAAFLAAGRPLEFHGTGLHEKGHCRSTGEVLVEVDAKFWRPLESLPLLGDPTKAKTRLGWESVATMESICREMVLADLYRGWLEIGRGQGRPSAESMAGDPSALETWYGEHMGTREAKA